MVFFVHWCQAGIKQVSDLFDSCEGHFLSFKGCPKSRNAGMPETRNAGNEDPEILKPGMIFRESKRAK